MRFLHSDFVPPVIGILIVAAMAFFAPPVKAADAGSCYAVQSADARQYCLAKARGEPGQCYAIQSPDLRALCLTEVRR